MLPSEVKRWTFDNQLISFIVKQCLTFIASSFSALSICCFSFFSCSLNIFQFWTVGRTDIQFENVSLCSGTHCFTKTQLFGPIYYPKKIILNTFVNDNLLTSLGMKVHFLSCEQQFDSVSSQCPLTSFQLLHQSA